MTPKEHKAFLKAVRIALKEDIGRGDITTSSIVSNEKTLGIIFPKSDGVLCGIGIAEMVYAEIDTRISFKPEMRDGDVFSPGMTLATIVGPAAGCLTGERVALNFLQRLSGIATLTARFVEAVKGQVKILDTRKTTPGLRLLEKYAVRIGGGYNHRIGLYDMVLIKDNHIEIASSITAAVSAVRKHHRRIFIEVEVKTLDELREALKLKIKRIMLDNMNPIQIQRAVDIARAARPDIEIEISGGIDIHNIEEYANTGVDYISVGSLTHSAPAIDIALKMKSLGHIES